MKNRTPSNTSTIIALSLGLLGLPAAMAQSSASLNAPGHVKGRVLVGTRAGLPAAELDKALSAHGGKARRIGKTDLHIVDLPAGRSEVEVVQQLARHPHFKFAELDRLLPMSLVANDPYAGSQWHVGKIGANAAWDQSLGDGVTIAILDTGINAAHPDLVSKIVPGYNAYANTTDTTDTIGHGTSVAGAAAAATNNGMGVSGIAGLSRIMPIKVATPDGLGSYSAIASGLTYAADRGVRVANVSVAGTFKSATITSAAQYFKGKNGLVFVSAGNSGIDEASAVNSAMIPVAATDSNDARPTWSSFGQFVALAAPGSGIWTTSSTGDYRAASGTSFASPIAAGVAALMMAANPALSAAQIESILTGTAVDLGAAGRDPYFGHGRVDAARAVSAAKTTVATDTTAPTVSLSGLSAGLTLSGTVNIDATATDNVGVSRVDLKVNGVTVASDTAAPHQFALNTATLANGAALITATAYDAAGNAGSSAAVSVTIANGVLPLADTTAPTIQIANPVEGSTVSGTVQVSVRAADDRGPIGLTQTLSIDGKVVASSSSTGTLSYSWNTRKAAVGRHTLTATARDASGNVSTATVTVVR